LPDQAVSCLSFYPEAHYAVRREAWWKKGVSRIASAPPRPATPRPCAMPSAPRWHTLSIRVGARATPAPPAAATSSSLNATTAPVTTGRSLVSSSATCASTTISRSATSGRQATRRRLAWCATCWTRHSIRFAPSRRRSRSVATRPPGWRSFAVSLASTSRARSTAARITGRSGAGTAPALGKTSGGASRPPRSSRAHHSHRVHRAGPRRLAATEPSQAHGQPIPLVDHRPADHSRPAVEGQPAGHARLAADHRPAAHARPAADHQPAGRVPAAEAARIAPAAHPDQSIQAEGSTRASRRGGS